MPKLSGTDAHRERILKAALSLLTREGREAVTTRTVAEAAQVQPPVLYRIFGDKRGLLDAVASRGFAAYLAKKQPSDPQGDPVEALRAGWDLHVEFGLANPELYLLMYADPRPSAKSDAARQAYAMLRSHMQNVAASGRLQVSLERACALYHAAALGIVLTLLSEEAGQRDMNLSASTRDRTLAAITTEAVAIVSSDMPAAANRLIALLEEQGREPHGLSAGESMLLAEWLQRLADIHV